MRISPTLFTLAFLVITSGICSLATAQKSPQGRAAKASVTSTQVSGLSSKSTPGRQATAADEELTDEEKLALAQKQAAALKRAKAAAAKRAAEARAASKRTETRELPVSKSLATPKLKSQSSRGQVGLAGPQKSLAEQQASQRQAADTKAKIQAARQLKSKKLAEAKLQEQSRQRLAEIAKLKAERMAQSKAESNAKTAPLSRLKRAPGQVFLNEPIALPGQNGQQETSPSSGGGINVTGRPETEEPAPAPSRTRTPINAGNLFDVRQPVDRDAARQTKDESEEGSDAGGNYAPVNYADVELSMNNSNVTLPPGTHYLTVNIDRNGYAGNLYLCCLFTEIYNADQANLLRGLMTPVPGADQGLPYSNGSATVAIIVNPNASHGLSRQFKITGATCEGPYLTITPMFFTVTVDNPEPEVTEEEEDVPPNSPETSDSGMITVANGGLVSPFLSGSVNVSGQPIGAFYDYNGNHQLDFVTGGNASYVYPRKPTAANNSQGYTLSRGRAFDGNANVAVVAMMNTWASVVRPQYVVLYLHVSGTTVTPVSMWAGDNTNNADLPDGGSMQGVVMANQPGNLPQISIQQVQLPGNGSAGVLKGSAVANVFFTTPSGDSTYGSTVQFEFDVPLLYDQTQP